VTISTATSGATIRYTTDGSIPTKANGQLYSGPVNVSITTALKAAAFATGHADSTVTVGIYSIGAQQVAAPVFSSAGPNGHSVTITSDTGGASIRYTTDGTTPTETNGTLYSAPITINATSTLQAIAYESGYSDSPVTSATIEIPTITITSPVNGSVVQ
jgi:hypothetical protein